MSLARRNCPTFFAKHWIPDNQSSLLPECFRLYMELKEVNQEPIELLTVAECARRCGFVAVTLRRAIALRGVKPDAILIEGSHQLRSPLFVAPRLKELSRLVKS